MHLLDLFKKNIEEDQLLDLIDKYNGDICNYMELKL